MAQVKRGYGSKSRVWVNETSRKVVAQKIHSLGP